MRALVLELRDPLGEVIGRAEMDVTEAAGPPSEAAARIRAWCGYYAPVTSRPLFCGLLITEAKRP